MEKRKAPRIQPFVASCRYVVGEQRYGGFLTNLSRAGARVHTDAEPPPVGAGIGVEVRLGRQATHLRVPGTVRWTQSSPRGGFVFGMSFDGIGPEEQKVLDGVIEEFRRRAAQLA
jgi:PilZ domain